MVATLGDDAPAISTVHKWAADFITGRESLEDDPRSGRLVTLQPPPKNTLTVVMDDRHFKLIRY